MKLHTRKSVLKRFKPVKYGYKLKHSHTKHFLTKKSSSKKQALHLNMYICLKKYRTLLLTCIPYNL